MEDVLSPVSGRKPTCVLVEGCPGVGKTTFSMEVCKKWAQGKMFQDFSTVVLLKLRDKWVQNAKGLSDLIHYSDQDMQKCIATEITEAQGKDTLIILDGLDELPSSLLTKESVFGQLLSGTCLPRATVLVTSRPSVTGKLLSTLEWSSQISRHVEVLGFTKDNIQEYAKSVLSPEELPEFMKYLSMHRHIQTMMYIPLNSAIVAEVYKQNKKFKKRDPTTATQLYTDLTYTILQRYMDDHADDHLDDHADYQDLVLEHNDVSHLHVPSPVYSAFKELCRIAYDRLMRQEMIFSDLERKFEHLGFMSASNEMRLVGSRNCSVSHSFLHLSIQEYLAAVHVFSQMGPHQQMQLLKQYCEHEYLNNFWRYVFGLTQLKGFDLTVVRECFIPQSNVIEVKPLELLYETQEADCLSVLGESVIIVCSFTLSPGTAAALAYCVAHSKCSWKLSLWLDDDTAETLTDGLQNCDPSRTGCILRMRWQRANTLYLQRIPSHLLHNITELYIGEVPNSSGLVEVVSCMNKLQSLQLNKVNLNFFSADHFEGLQTLRDLKVTVSTVSTAGATFLQQLILSTRQLDALHLSDTEVTPEGMVIILRALCRVPLQELHMFGCNLQTKVSHALSAVLKANQSLLKLNLKSCIITDHEALHLAEGFHHSAALQEVNMMGISVSDLGAIAIADGLLHSKTLKVLSIGGIQGRLFLMSGTTGTTSMETTHLPPELTLNMSCNQVGDSGATAIAEALRHNQTLTTLNMSQNRVGDSGATAIAEAVCHNQTLTTLDMSENRVGYSGATAIVEALRHNQTLTTLDMSWNQVGDSGATAIAEALRHNHTLTTLDMSRNQVGDSGATAIAEAVRHNRTLTTLSMSGNQVGVNGATAIAKALRHNQTLTTLNMYRNQVGDSGATAIAEALRHNQTLTTLDMSYNQVGDSGATAIAKALRHNQTLTVLHMDWSQVRDRNATAAIAEALRHNQTLTTLDRNSGATARH